MAIQNLKVIILPKNGNPINKITIDLNDPTGVDKSDWKIISLPHPRTSSPVKYIFNSSTLYELRQIQGSNPHLKDSQRLETEDGSAIKSLLIESSTPGNHTGLIIEDPSVYVTSPFNPVYLLISFFVAKKYHLSDTTRFISLEDLVDSMESQDKFEPMAVKLPMGILEDGLSKICESIEENGDTFYKFSMKKTLEFLQHKTNKLKSLEEEKFPKSILQKLIIPLVTPADSTSSTPPEILDAAKLKYSISLIGSYLPQVIVNELAKSFKEDLTKLDEYLQQQKQIKDKKKLAEEGLREMDKQIKAGGNSRKKPVSKKTAGIKKPTAPRKVVRGALDNFFKKKVT
ncbi:hypothetical protein DASC09_049280 [Saccharomycopsis crataegensis]|uniref:Ribonuclease H2 subunit B n=1 Tax=Saccharomycopsis crataegensis TaxID=43959 RepID=A0AAV5QTZ0_9ASCO|nr:hypothetical protein DASC09_049280 [Saccharomycopsis crataegensis]